MESKPKKPLLLISADKIHQHFQRVENWFKEIHQRKDRQPPCNDELSIHLLQRGGAEENVKEMKREIELLQNEVLQLKKQLEEESRQRAVASQTDIRHKLLEAELHQHDGLPEENVQIQDHSDAKQFTKNLKTLWPFRWFMK